MLFLLLEKTSFMEVCQEDARDNSKQKGILNAYECVICAQTCKSTEDRPIGLVVLMVPSTGNLIHERFWGFEILFFPRSWYF